MNESPIQQKSFAFSLTIIKLYKELLNRKEYVISKQLLRSGTSIGANVEEGNAAQSKKDFLSKIFNRLQRGKRNKVPVAVIIGIGTGFNRCDNRAYTRLKN